MSIFFLLVLNGNTTTTITATYSNREYDDDYYSYNGQSQQRHRLLVRSSLSYDLKLTMDRSWILILAPLGSLMVTLATNPDCRDCNKLLICSSITLLILFAFLYFDLQHAAYEQVTSQRGGGSELCRALLLTVIKFLGWAVWTVGACLVVLIIRQRDGTMPPRS